MVEVLWIGHTSKKKAYSMPGRLPYRCTRIVWSIQIDLLTKGLINIIIREHLNG